MFQALLMSWGLMLPGAGLEGVWKYDGLVYEDIRYPLPNENLDLTFTFRQNGTARLFWQRRNEAGFCEREGIFWVSGDLLYQESIWLNPENRFDCQEDPDMIPGRKTINRFVIKETELHIYFVLDEKDLIYVLKKQASNTPQVKE